MKKIFLLAGVITVILTSSFTSVSAERETQLPVKLKCSEGSRKETYTLTEFDIWGWEETQYPYEKKTKDILFTIKGMDLTGDSFNIKFDFFDKKGNYLDSDVMELDEESIDSAGIWTRMTIPELTASIEISALHPAEDSDSYYYCKYVNMYSDDGRVLGVQDLLAINYSQVGWRHKTWVYHPDGREKFIEGNCVDTQCEEGWYEYPVTYIYAPDGRVKVIRKEDVKAWKKVGWSDVPYVKMYALDGRCEIVKESDVEAWEKVGWYRQLPTTTLYAPDGRKEEVPIQNVDAWKRVGWYDEPVYYVSSTGCFDNVDRLVRLSEIEWCPNGTNISLEEALSLCSKKSREFQEQFATEEESEEIILEMYGQNALEEYRNVIYTSNIIDFSPNVYLIAVNLFEAWELYSVNKTTGSCIWCWGGQEWEPGLFNKYK